MSPTVTTTGVILMVCQVRRGDRRGDSRVRHRDGLARPVVIYAVVALVGAARAFEIPTMVAIIPALVPRPLVPAATAWFASANQAGQIVGPVLGGVLYRWARRRSTASPSCCGLVGVMLHRMMRMERAPRSAEPLSLRSPLGGFRFVRAIR